MDQVEALTRRNRSWAWNYGRQLPFTFRCEGQFAWGNLQLHLQVDGGIVRHAQAFSDAMDWEIAPALETGPGKLPLLPPGPVPGGGGLLPGPGGRALPNADRTGDLR